MKKLKIGIIGCGGIAHAHMRSYLAMDDVEVVAGADIIPGKAEAFFKEFEVEGAKCFESHKELLKLDLDAVSVCTYNSQHAVCSIDAMNAGKHVLLEKPFTVTMQQAVDVMRAERETGKIISIGFQPRNSKNMQNIKSICQSGRLGDIYYIQTGGGRRLGIPCSDSKTTFIEKETGGVGALGDIGCYSLDMVLNAIGYPKPLTVSGYKSDFFGKNPYYVGEHCASKFGVDDFAAAFIRLEGGIILDFRISWAMHVNTPGDTLIMGKDAGLRIPSTDCWNGSIGGPMTIYSKIGNSLTETTIPVIDEKDPAGLGLFGQKVRSFLDAVKTGGKAPVPTSQIIYNQAIISGIVESAEVGREIEIKIPEI